LGASATGAATATGVAGAVSFLATFLGAAAVLAGAVELICIPGAEEVLEGILRVSTDL